MSGYLVVVNRKAGGAEDDRLRAAVDALRPGGPVDVVATADQDDVDDVVAGVGDRTLVVAGGDGSLHLVVERLHVAGSLRGTLIGLVPLGTGNDFARGSGLPLDPSEAALRVRSGRTRPMDVIVEEGSDRVVVNAAHAGVGVDAARYASALKRFLGPFAYPAAAVVAGIRAAPQQITVEVDGAPVEVPGAGEHVLLVLVANGPTVGGGTPLVGDARPDDGFLDVLLVADRGLPGRVAFGVRVARGRTVDGEGVVTARGEHVLLRGEPAPFNVDGDVQDPAAERSLRLLPSAWTLAG